MYKNKSLKRLYLSLFFVFFACLVSSATGSDSCSSSGSVQYKPNGSCSTQSRTCCGNGYYSNWDSTCSGADNCKPGECYMSNGTCSGEPPAACSCANGTCTRTWKCTPGTGWSYTDGACKCNSGYVLKNGKCEKKANCLEGRSMQYSKATCSECWNTARNMTNNVPKCTTPTSVHCYVMQNPLGYESVSTQCPNNNYNSSTSYNFGGGTSIITMRYNTNVSGINCYFENVWYRTCID